MEEIEQAVVAAPGEPEGTHDTADPQQVAAGTDPDRCQRQPRSLEGRDTAARAKPFCTPADPQGAA